ncbi:MAG TPA: DUF1003 domain-containing protein [Tepidisphaeraceae bacterium]|jgi:uncharacterized membrane protein
MNVDVLKKIPLLAKLNADEAARLSELLAGRSFKENEPVIWVGEPGEELFLINSGRVQVTSPDDQGRDVLLGTLGPGDFFGDVALLDGGPRTASVRTIEPAELCVLKRSDFLRFLREHPDAALDVLSIVGHRHRETLDKLRGVRNPQAAIERQSTPWQRTADIIAKVSASQAFVLVHVIWFGGWIGSNLLLPEGRRFDPFPFGFLTLVVSLEAIFLSIFVLISANRAGEKDRIRADADYQTNVKSQYEIMQLHAKLDKLIAAVPGDRAAPRRPDESAEAEPTGPVAGRS